MSGGGAGLMSPGSSPMTSGGFGDSGVSGHFGCSIMLPITAIDKPAKGFALDVPVEPLPLTLTTSRFHLS
jgi:hypothetical protein